MSAFTDAVGLSPRVRGNRQPLLVAQIGDRSIPACAGEPLTNAGHDDLWQVYPRVCGGTIRGPDGNGWWLGLSPRVRGNPR